MKVVAIAASESAQPPEGIVVAFISIGFSLLRFFHGVESVCVAKGVGVLREGAGVAIVSLGEQSLGVKRVAVDSGGARAFLHHFFHLAHSAIKIEFEAHKAIRVGGQINQIVVNHKHRVVDSSLLL